jgi:hypothetical protein
MSNFKGDPAHRGINDNKNGLKQTKEYLHATLLLMTIFLNLAYSPYKSSTWWGLKKEICRLFLKCGSPDDKLFQEHKHNMAAELGLGTLNTAEDDLRLFLSLQGMNSLKEKGPYVKLTRWCSWETGFEFHRTELSTPTQKKRTKTIT